MAWRPISCTCFLCRFSSATAWRLCWCNGIGGSGWVAGATGESRARHSPRVRSWRWYFSFRPRPCWGVFFFRDPSGRSNGRLMFPPISPCIRDWIQPDEIVASDMPWAVAWYADRKSVWIPDTPETLFQINDYKELGGAVPAHLSHSHQRHREYPGGLDQWRVPEVDGLHGADGRSQDDPIPVENGHGPAGVHLLCGSGKARRLQDLNRFLAAEIAVCRTKTAFLSAKAAF